MGDWESPEWLTAGCLAGKDRAGGTARKLPLLMQWVMGWRAEGEPRSWEKPVAMERSRHGPGGGEAGTDQNLVTVGRGHEGEGEGRQNAAMHMRNFS